MVRREPPKGHWDLTLQSPGLVAAFAALFLMGGTAHSASFSCDQARSAVEKTICGNAELSTLDEHLGRYYSAARSVLKSAGACLATEQRDWLRSRRDACSDGGCLRQAYLRRLAELDPLQPGVTRIRNIELPGVNALVWIVPPASDQVAAPARKDAKPIVARGAIVNEISEGDGYVLRTAEGTRMLVVPLMFLESPTTEVLESLARGGGAEYELRGYSEAGANGRTHFAPSRCIFVYRIVK